MTKKWCSTCRGLYFVDAETVRDGKPIKFMKPCPKCSGGQPDVPHRPAPIGEDWKSKAAGDEVGYEHE